MTLSNDLTEAIRVGEFLIDQETGEIYSHRDVGIDDLVQQLKDAQEQEKAWEQTKQILKRAIGKKLDDANVGAAETPYGVVRWQTQLRRSAKADRFCEMAAEYGVSESVKQRTVFAAATSLDPKMLDSEVAALERFGQSETSEDIQLRRAIDATIEENPVSFVLLQPLRKAAPRLERVTVDTGDY